MAQCCYGMYLKALSYTQANNSQIDKNSSSHLPINVEPRTSICPDAGIYRGLGLSAKSESMEEFCPIIVNGYVLSLTNNKRVRPEDFDQTPKGTRFTKEALGRFLTGYYGRMQQIFQHPTRNEKQIICALLNSKSGIWGA